MSTVMTIGERPQDPAIIVNQTKPKRIMAYIIYAKLRDQNQLADATRLENREFYYLPMNEKIQSNEIIIVDKMGVYFEMITRTIRRDGLSYIDTRTEINKESYVALRDMSEYGYKCMYYEFPIPDTPEKWEVTQFIDVSGHPHPWVRIEYYQDNPDKPLPQLPFGIVDCLVEGDSENTPAQRSFIDRLWSTEWTRIDKSDVIRI